MIFYITCCFICFVASNRRSSTAELTAPTSSRPAIQLNTISGSQGYPAMIALQRIPYPSSASNGAKADLRSGEPPRYDEIFEAN